MSRLVTLFLAGDVMTGRGIDQILPHPSVPAAGADDPRGYVALAEEKNGPVPRPVDFGYPWGDALAELERARPDARIVNLETAVTSSEDWAPETIGYRMHPANLPCLAAAGLDCCVLANNHALDFGVAGLLETLDSLSRAGLAWAGAGRDVEEAEAPAALDRAGARILVFATGFATSGVRPAWGAAPSRPGVSYGGRPDAAAASAWASRVARYRRAGDVVVASLHWGGNWGYRIEPEEALFARALIDRAGVDVVYGHSSHHPKAVEVYRGKLILYGCGDLVNDYEGISGYEEYRDDLGCLYLAAVEAGTGVLERLEVVPMQMKRLRLARPSKEDAAWRSDVVRRESVKRGTHFERTARGLAYAAPA